MLKTGFALRAAQEEPKSLGDCETVFLRPDLWAREDRQYCIRPWNTGLFVEAESLFLTGLTQETWELLGHEYKDGSIEKKVAPIAWIISSIG